MPEGRDVESSGESDVDDNGKKSAFVNPLAKKSGKAEESEEWSDDDFSEGGTRLTGEKKEKAAKKDKDTVLGKRKRKGSLDNI